MCVIYKVPLVVDSGVGMESQVGFGRAMNCAKCLVLNVDGPVHVERM